MKKGIRQLSLLQRLLLAFATRPLVVRLRRRFGHQPNDRDQAEKFCETAILPALTNGRPIVLDFEGTAMVTQSFIHALIAMAVKEDPRRAERISVTNASRAQQAVVNLALRHMISPTSNVARNIQHLQPN